MAKKFDRDAENKRYSIERHFREPRSEEFISALLTPTVDGDGIPEVEKDLPEFKTAFRLHSKPGKVLKVRKNRRGFRESIESHDAKQAKLELDYVEIFLEDSPSNLEIKKIWLRKRNVSWPAFKEMKLIEVKMGVATGKAEISSTTTLGNVRIIELVHVFKGGGGDYLKVSAGSITVSASSETESGGDGSIEFSGLGDGFVA